ncbi:hypothetical protein C7974DRAFT_372743 [Boeremia exigua]|uniref:uncharacterized protein n=1 Tax=Boeremia exigua TaxID=749465 RepID=UPI001E8DB70F|nr:uncharacterized protein C7974DRAFT_372743 [Boeremia exigua]KAH6642887.1 hypothetical protein C7974DRAFT_372743 [Boeremia exigua]
MQPVDYLKRFFSGLRRRTRRPRGRNLKQSRKRLKFAGGHGPAGTARFVQRRQAAPAHHESSSALLAPRLEGDQIDERRRAWCMAAALGKIIAMATATAIAMANFGDSGVYVWHIGRSTRLVK